MNDRQDPRAVYQREYSIKIFINFDRKVNFKAQEFTIFNVFVLAINID